MQAPISNLWSLTEIFSWRDFSMGLQEGKEARFYFLGPDIIGRFGQDFGGYCQRRNKISVFKHGAMVKCSDGDCSGGGFSQAI